METVLVISLVIGAAFLVSFFIVSKIPGGCNRDCNQGRNCNCGDK